jgi:signal transduction histidine kinase
MDRTVADLLTFSDTERLLLRQRTAIAEVDLHNTQRLVIAGSTLAALLIIFANLMTSRALAHQKKLTHAAQAAERAKSEFLAIMSHEIRTPMNGVIGMTSVLTDTNLDEMQRDCVNTITTSGESLLTVINDILDFSKIESGRMELEIRSFDLRNCLDEALNLFAAEIRIKRLEAVYLVASNIPTHFMGDATRLRQILVNLIGKPLSSRLRGKSGSMLNAKGKTNGAITWSSR